MVAISYGIVAILFLLCKKMRKIFIIFPIIYNFAVH